MPSFSAAHTASCAAEIARRRAAAPHRALDSRLVHVVGGQADVLRAGLAEDLEALLLRLPQGLDRLDLRHVHDQHRRIDQPRQRDRAVGRLGLGDARMGDSVELRRTMALLDQMMRQPLDHVVVLGMHHHQRTLAPRQRQDVEHLVVADLHGVVGHVDLERSVAVLDQRRQVLAQRLWAGIGDDEVEGVVDHGLGRRRLVIVVDHLAQRHAAMLGGKRNDGRRPAERRRHRARIEIVGAHHAHAGLLLDMHMAVDAARKDELVAGIDLARRGAFQAGLDGGDAPVPDPNVSLGLAIFGDDLCVTNDQVVVSHSPLTPPPVCANVPTPPIGAPAVPSSLRVPRDRLPSATNRARAASGS